MLPNALDFELTGAAPDNILDFTVGCDFYVLTFKLDSSEKPMPVDRIYTGQDGVATSNPLIFERKPDA